MPRRLSRACGCGEQNLYARAKELVGDRDPAATSFRSNCGPSTLPGAAVGSGWAVLLALCSALLQKSLKGGLVVVGGLNLGGSIDPVLQRRDVAELAVEKGRR